MKVKDQARAPRREIIDDLTLLLEILPPKLRAQLDKDRRLPDLVEVVLDLGRPAEARFFDRVRYFDDIEVGHDELEYTTSRLGPITGDNRAGIERTLHRISAIRNRRGEIVGLTCRVGRAVTGTVDIIRDVIETGESPLLLGPPGVGKTTLLREAARVLADELERRVVVVDTSNEIAGDGDVPHPGIGRARRMQVISPELQHRVMIEAVENHMPEVIVIDEIGTLEEALAARTIAERGVQLIATAHGLNLDNLIINPTLSDLIGGIQAVTLSDEEARRRGTQKTVLERKAPPTFDNLVEIQHRDRLAIYSDIASVVDRCLAGVPVRPEVRVRGADGQVQIHAAPAAEERRSIGPVTDAVVIRLFPIGLTRPRVQKAIQELKVPVMLTDSPDEADVVLSLKAHSKRPPKGLQRALDEGVEFYTIKSNTLTQIRNFLRRYCRDAKRPEAGGELGFAIREAEDAVIRVQRSLEAVELSPQNSYVRRLQHEVAASHGIYSESRGKRPIRRVVFFPRES